VGAPRLEEVDVRFDDGRVVSIARIVVSPTKTLYVAHQLWGLFLRHKSWTPLQRRMIKMKDCGLSTDAHIQLLKAAEVVSRMTTATTLITREAAAAMLEGVPGMGGVLRQVGIEQGASASWTPIPVKAEASQPSGPPTPAVRAPTRAPVPRGPVFSGAGACSPPARATRCACAWSDRELACQGLGFRVKGLEDLNRVPTLGTYALVPLSGSLRQGGHCQLGCRRHLAGSGPRQRTMLCLTPTCCCQRNSSHGTRQPTGCTGTALRVTLIGLRMTTWEASRL
jgi:hypothetical protein